MTCRCVATMALRLGAWKHADGSLSLSRQEATVREAVAGPVVTRYAKSIPLCGYGRGPSCPPAHLTSSYTDADLSALAAYVAATEVA